ncbi:MAG: ABC transporter substrate-binding protein [Propionibacteriaceae bacterium]|nr:ABC transporter substrate-binding protein [Propionibacteriaceae bacterium]
MLKRPLAALLAVPLSLILASCGQPAATTSGADPTAEGPAASGGTLKVVGTDDHSQIDPVSYALVATNSIARSITRQLISYQASNDQSANAVPVGDLAEDVPTVSDDGLTYTFKLRSNAMWDTPTPRAITSTDVANGLKKICNPLKPAYTVTYFYSIVGFQEFCEAYDTDNPNVADIKKHILEDSVAGIETPDDTTVVIKLNSPASDFIYVLSLPNSSPVPVEALDYEPNSPDYIKNYISSGPYTVDEYVNDKHLYLKRSAGWNAESDPIRAANVDRIEITYGVAADAAMQQVQSGDANILYGMQVPPAQYATLSTTGDENIVIYPSGATFFLWINSVSPNNNGALAETKVRQALQYGVDKQAMVQQLGGPDVAEPATGIFGSTVVGHSNNDAYATTDSKGDPEKLKSLLTEAGVSNLKLKLAYRSDNATEPDIAQIIQQSFAAAGVEIELVPKPSSDFYGQFLMVHENGRNGEWDLALCGWNPTWAGGAARAVYQPQFTYPPEASYNYTDYNSDKAVELMKQAMAATMDEAPAIWAQVSDAVMDDPPVIPLYSRKNIHYHSPEVSNYLEYVLAQEGDWTNMALAS